MALPLPRGLTPPEIAYICEMEMVTVLPRQRLDALELLGGPTPALVPPHRGNIPLWLALLLKRQRRANIMPPPWLHRQSLEAILDLETQSAQVFSPAPKLGPAAAAAAASNGGADVASPPFVASSTSDAAPDALPYHWLEMGELLLEAAADDFDEADQVRRLLRDLREVRMAKLRAGVEALDAGGGVKMNGVGAMELAESRAFLGGVIDGLRRIGASREQARRESETEERAGGFGSAQAYDDEDMDL